MLRSLRELIQLLFVGRNRNAMQNSDVSHRPSKSRYVPSHTRSAEEAVLPGRQRLSVKFKTTNPNLVAAMSQHWSAGLRRETYQAVLEKLITSSLLVATPNGPPGGRPQLHEPGSEEEICVTIGRSNDGQKKVLCVFTDEPEFLRAKPPSGTYYEIHSTDLIEFAQRMGVDQLIINTASSIAVAVDSSYFTALAMGKLPDLQSTNANLDGERNAGPFISM